MPRLSILIPCLGGAADFDGTLVSLLQHRPADCEVLVVHSQPYDDPYDLAGEVSFIHATKAQSLAELINQGLKAARGEIVHLVACGLEVEEGWTEPALRHFADEETAAVAPVVLQSDGATIASAGMIWTLGGTRRICRSRSLKMLGPTLAAGFWRRSVLTALDGLETPLGDDLADVGLGLALQDLECKVVCEPRSRLVQTGAATQNASSGSLAAGRRAERLFWRQARQGALALSLLLHPLAVLGDCISLAPLGRLLALAELGAYRQYQRLLVRADRLLREDTVATVPMTAAAKKPIPVQSRKAA